MSEGALTPTVEVVTLPGVDDDTNALLHRLLRTLAQREQTNATLDAYYEAERNFRRWHGGTVPEQYYNLGLALGWCSKAVDALARRCNVLGMVWGDGDLDAIGYREVWDGNRLGSEIDQGITSALIHGVAFGVVSRGEESQGEPGGLVHFYSAKDATGTRNARSRRLDDLVVVNSRDGEGRIDGLTLYLPGRTVTAVRDSSGWETDESQHPFWVPAAPLVYRPRLGRPMGRTRLTRPVRGLQDAAVRALVRLEGHMDVYAFPEFWMLGADESIFQDENGAPQPKWKVMLGRIKGIPDDEDATNPRADVKKFEASSPQPHLAALNAYSKMFARETSLPDSAVAITDYANPTSAEAYDSSQYELVAEAEGALSEFSPALRHLVPLAMAMQQGLSEVPESWRSIDIVPGDVRYTSRAAQADAGVKQVSAAPWLADTEVGLRLLGLSPADITEALSERTRVRSQDMLSGLLGSAASRAGNGAVGG